MLPTRVGCDVANQGGVAQVDRTAARAGIGADGRILQRGSVGRGQRGRGGHAQGLAFVRVVFSKQQYRRHGIRVDLFDVQAQMAQHCRQRRVGSELRKHGVLRGEQAACLQGFGTGLYGVALKRVARAGFTQYQHHRRLAFVLARGGLTGNQHMGVVGPHQTVLDGLGTQATAHHARQTRHGLAHIIRVDQAGKLHTFKLLRRLRIHQARGSRVGSHDTPLHRQQHSIGRQARQRIEIRACSLFFGCGLRRGNRCRCRAWHGLWSQLRVNRKGSGIGRMGTVHRGYGCLVSDCNGKCSLHAFRPYPQRHASGKLKSTLRDCLSAGTAPKEKPALS